MRVRKYFIYFFKISDLSFHLAQRITFTEDEARFFIVELILAIEHLHAKNVVYRDMVFNFI